MPLSPGLLKIRKSTKIYSIYACSLGFILESSAVLALCLLAILICVGISWAAK